MTKRKLPSNASVATEGEDGRLVAPAASRNAEALCDLLASFAPRSGRALELASGTGQHVSAFAQHLPGLQWQPSEVEPERRVSIDAYTGDLPNVEQAVELDAAQAGWHRSFGDQDLIVLINLLHLISWPEVRTLICEAAQALQPGGKLILYGPFMRNGRLTSDGDQRFHDALIQQDAEIGYKDDTEMTALLHACHLDQVETVEMPADNLAFVAQKSAGT